MSRSSRRSAFMVLVLVTVGLSCAAHGPSGSVGSVSGDDPVIIERQEILDPAATQIEEWAQAADVSFSDVEVDGTDGALHVYRVGGTPDDSLSVDYRAQLPAPFTLDFRPATISVGRERALTATVTDLRSNDPGFAAVTDWGLETLGGEFVVHYTNDVPPRATESDPDLDGVVFARSQE